jgi:hypothetical protein
MKRFAVLLMLLSSPVWADIVGKPDGSVSCSGTKEQPCYGKIGPGGEQMVCQGSLCMEIKRQPPNGDTSDK